MSIILTPPGYTRYDHPMIFLAGPIQGADDWQSRAAKYIHQSEPNVIVANPRRDVKFEGEFNEEMYNTQVDWETHHLRSAAKRGTVLFWLGRESEHSCKRSFAQTTRFELGEWFAWHRRNGKEFAIGIEDGYTGGRYVKRRLSQDMPDVQIHPNLEETCFYAAALIYDQFGRLSAPVAKQFRDKDHWLYERWR